MCMLTYARMSTYIIQIRNYRHSFLPDFIQSFRREKIYYTCFCFWCPENESPLSVVTQPPVQASNSGATGELYYWMKLIPYKVSFIISDYAFCWRNALLWARAAHAHLWLEMRIGAESICPLTHDSASARWDKVTQRLLLGHARTVRVCACDNGSCAWPFIYLMC